MNQHLEPVFKVLLPALEKSRVDYWVYGGVSIVAHAVNNSDKLCNIIV